MQSGNTIIRLSIRDDVNPEVVNSIAAKFQKMWTQIYMDLSYPNPQARVQKYCFKL